MIDLRSDTVTQPGPAMRAAMAAAEVGDDVYGEDPTVRELEARAAALLGKQAGLFAPSGTQSNLLALLTHCGRGDEYIVGQQAHTYRFEGGGAAALGGIQPQPLEMVDGCMPVAAIEQAVKPDDFHFARTRVVCLENTHGGRPLTAAYCEAVAALCERHGLILHMDGARLFNAAVDGAVTPAALVAACDSVSICLSKGLGAPVGSVLVGSADVIAQARRWRKMLGGGMRQAGVLAAAGLYALEHHIDRLAHDHQRAAALAGSVAARFGDDAVEVATNMLHLTLPGDVYERLARHLAAHGIRVGRPRWVLHLDVGDDDLAAIQAALAAFPA